MLAIRRPVVVLVLISATVLALVWRRSTTNKTPRGTMGGDVWPPVPSPAARRTA